MVLGGIDVKIRDYYSQKMTEWLLNAIDPQLHSLG